MTQRLMSRESREPYYDMSDDWSLIVASFQSQYGIRLSQELKNMSFREFSYLLNGLGSDTPLGQIVSIRAEKDPTALKDFTPEQKRIRSEYLQKIAKQKPKKEVDNIVEQFKQAFIQLAQ